MGQSPLHLAAPLQSSSEIDLIQILLLSEPDLDLKGQDGDTVLVFAVIYAKVFSVEVLLVFGSDPNAKNHAENTPLHPATERRHVGIVGLLLNSQADPTYSNACGVNPLALALSLEDSVIVEMLLKGVDGNGHPHKFNSLDRAASEGFLEKLNDEIELEKQKRIDHQKREAEDERYRRNRCCHSP